MAVVGLVPARRDLWRRRRVAGGVRLGAPGRRSGLGPGGGGLGIARRLHRVLDVGASIGGVAQDVGCFGRALLGGALQGVGLVAAALSATGQDQWSEQRKR